MCRLAPSFVKRGYGPFAVVVAHSDRGSVAKLGEAVPGTLFAVHRVHRAREVGQDYASSVLTTLLSLRDALVAVARTRPRLVIMNGPAICVPVALACRLLGVFRRRRVTLVFVESFCRVRTLSLTGRILRPLVDVFAVQWPALHELYPGTVLASGIL